ncbi:HAMP domain-containing sensor histidine kinase [Nonomuraea sp. H19]|uniref:sensor histidine kinase n=1 Tax=Nonomuraea sp. H19 TaxID=3452206 RepID=UPI003F89A13E
MRLLPRSMRARVTLVTAVGAVGALALCLTLLYAALDRQLWDAIDAGLAGRAGDLAAALEVGDTAALADDPLAQLYGPGGDLLAGSAALPNQRLLTPEQVRQVGDVTLTTRTLRAGEDGGPIPVRLLSERVGPSGGVLTVGVSAEPVHAARNRLAIVLFLAAPLLAGALAAGAWAVVRTALRPVDALTREAAIISSLESDSRLPEVPGEDEIARLAHTLNDMLARLGVAAERERAFVDDASHELRTPIAVLRGELELALDAIGDDREVEESLRAALEEADRLSRLADDLLLLARARTGALVVRTEAVDLLDLAVAEARRLGPALGVRIEASGDPVVVNADPERLRQVLANLARNSAAAGATTVRVQVAHDRETATVQVADDGPGFPPGLLDAAFARFTRGDDARSGAGAGLGLSIVQAVVSAHGGTVSARNGDPLGGAVVTARLALP